MYFIHYKKHDVFILYDGIAYRSDFKRENHYLIGADSLEKAKKTLTSIKSIFPKNERGQLQIITESTLKANIAKPSKSKNIKSVLSDLSLTATKFTSMFEKLITEGHCKKINSRTYILPITAEKVKSRKVLPTGELTKTLQKNIVENPPLPKTISQPSSTEEELVFMDRNSHVENESKKSLINAFSENNNFINNSEDTLTRLSQLLVHALESTIEYQEQIKSIENQITDELHFIEFEPSHMANTDQVYERLHELRKQRRHLKDNYYVAQLLQTLFLDITPENLTNTIEHLQKINERVYSLRAPGKHKERGY